MSIPGADISGWQPENVNLSGLEFVYIKSTQGTYKVNAHHDAQVDQARTAGLVVGHYHFPAWGDPVAEAQAFVSANGARLGEFLVLDIEDSPQTPWPADPVTWCCAFVDEVHRLTGLWCMNYCGPNVRHTWDWTMLAQRGGGLISPEYNSVGPSDPSPWAGTAMWQNANTNISGGDSDIFFGDRAALLAYGTPNGVTPDAGTITPIQEAPDLDADQNAALAEAWQNSKDIKATLGRLQQILEAVDVQINNRTTGNVRVAAELIQTRIDNIPAAVWNAKVLGESTAAGVLNHIDAKPALTAAPASVDVDALAAKLVATLPPAFISALAVKLSQP